MAADQKTPQKTQEKPKDQKDNQQDQDEQKDDKALTNSNEQQQDQGSDADEEDDIPQFRTVQQQEKYENYIKQKRQQEGGDKSSPRSRSASRRARRKRIQEGIDSGKYMKTSSLEALEEADAQGTLKSMGMFERIGNDSTSMDGPVTQARAMRGEIPMRGTDPNQPYQMEKKDENSLDQQDGLKLTLEANLDVEIELKASIRGDLTLSLYE